MEFILNPNAFSISTDLLLQLCPMVAISGCAGRKFPGLSVECGRCVEALLRVAMLLFS